RRLTRGRFQRLGPERSPAQAYRRWRRLVSNHPARARASRVRLRSRRHHLGAGSRRAAFAGRGLRRAQFSHHRSLEQSLMRRLAALSIALVAVAPVAAQDARLAARLDPPVLDRVTYMLDSVRTAGLPTEPLVDKALEGASKRAS